MKKDFSVREAIQFGWDTVKSNLGFFIGLMIVVVLLTLIPDKMANMTKESAPLLSGLTNFAGFCIQLILGMGLIKIALRFCDRQKAEFNDLFSCVHLFLNYAAGSILYGLIILGGLILFVVPGIIWGLKFQYFKYLIVEKGFGPIQALKASSAITMGAKGELFIFWSIIFGINLLGIFALFVGLFITIPITMLADAFVYRLLLHQTPEIAQQISSTEQKA